MATKQQNGGPRGLTPKDRRKLALVQKRLETFLDRRGYESISTPTMESTDLFLRKSGGELAAKMFSFTDPGGRRVSLRPEFTSSVVRHYVEGSLKQQLPLRLQYCGSVFRYDSGDKGSREFTQFGAELLGADRVAADAEAMAFAVQSLSALGIKGHGLRVGHMGVVNKLLESLRLSERARVFLLASLTTLRDGGEGQEQVRHRALKLGLLRPRDRPNLNQLARRLESKDAEQMVEGFLTDAVTGATGQRTPEEVFLRYLKKLRESEDPILIERAMEFSSALINVSGPSEKSLIELRALLRYYSLDPTSLEPVERLLEEIGCYDLGQAPLILDLGMARGMAYYTGAVFEIDHPRITGLPALGGGGRYDGLVRALGGRKEVPALGFALALDRVIELLPTGFGNDEPDPPTRVLVVAAEATMAQAVETAERLRSQGIPAELDIVSKTERDASRYAQRRGITTVMRVGRDGKTDEHEF